jgi:hypothetical protein
MEQCPAAISWTCHARVLKGVNSFKSVSGDDIHFRKPQSLREN